MTTAPRGSGRPAPGGRSPRARLDTLDGQLQRAREQQRDQDRLLQVALGGGATAQEWASVLGDEPEQLLLEALPTLVVRRARRSAGLRRPELQGLDGYLDLALEVLAHEPDEDIDTVITDHADAMVVVPRAAAATPEDRWLAARALAVLGHDGGTVRRGQLWGSGLAADRAQERCDPYRWSNVALLDWEHLEAVITPDLDDAARAALERGGAIHFQYAALARMIDDGLFNDVEAATRGQTRPEGGT
jgi:hypothetical protein